MPVICAATGCNNKFVKGSGIRFYRFPLCKPQLASKWVHSLGMKNFIPTANTCLCSEHFRPDCFRDYNGKQILRADAVPTLFTHGQDSSKMELRRRGMVPQETNVENKMETQTVRDGATEAADLHRDKRGEILGDNTMPQVFFLGPITQNPHPVGSLKRRRKNQQDDKGSYVKKPPNAFMLFSKEQRSIVKAELSTRDSRSITTALGERWMALSTAGQDRYFEEAHRLRRLHQQEFPDWTPNSHKKRKADPVQSYYPGHC